MTRGRRAGRIRPAEPQRRCIACRTARKQADLLRLSIRDGKVVPGNGPGRGCYVCRDPECARKAHKGGRIGRAIKGTSEVPELTRLLGWLKPGSA
ncbi:MAG: YlxR family protein [Myxococcales bacterium]